MKAYELRAGTQGHGTTNYNEDAISEITGLEFDLENEPSYTQAQFAAESDINEIVRRFGLTGELPENYRPPMSGDFTNITTFEEMQNAIADARSRFMELPAEIREKFENDPGRLINFLDDEKNRAQALELGIIQQPPESPRDMVQAIDELKTALTPPKTE